MSVQKDTDKFFMSITEGEKKPFDFLRVLYDGCIAGGVAGVMVETALYPIDTIKTRLQVARDGGKIVLKGLYSGLSGNLVGVLPASAIFIGVYEPTKQQLLQSLPENLSVVAHFAKRDPNDPENAMLGAVAGAITGAVTTPLDVVKTRLMVQGSQNHYKGISDCVRTIVKEEGTHALFKGIGPRVLWIGVGGSIFFCALEKTKQILARNRQTKAEIQK